MVWPNVIIFSSTVPLINPNYSTRRLSELLFLFWGVLITPAAPLINHFHPGKFGRDVSQMKKCNTRLITQIHPFPGSLIWRIFCLFFFLLFCSLSRPAECVIDRCLLWRRLENVTSDRLALRAESPFLCKMFNYSLVKPRPAPRPPPGLCTHDCRALFARILLQIRAERRQNLFKKCKYKMKKDDDKKESIYM